MKQLLVLACVLVAANAFYADDLRVTLSHGGGVTGKFLNSLNGRGIRAFTGIPYAEAPVGNYRFADPIMKTGWTGFFDHKYYDKVICPQFENYHDFNKVFKGQEDCLYLNVYVPQTLKNFGSVKDLPVMFYLHGGGFYSGTGNQQFYAPDFLLDHDVILVTGNYRLGSLGFLFNDDEHFVGNYGLKDQIMMLKWIQDNIHFFGGNKDKVTIFGDNAGAASIGFHMMSPLSKGLFHQAILQGGTQYNQWAFQDKERMIKNTVQLMKEVGCYDIYNKIDLVQCMRTKNVYDILEKTYGLFDWATDPMVTFGPVFDKYFITQDLYDSKDYWGNTIPVIVGINSDEGAYKYVKMLNNYKWKNDFVSNFDYVVPFIFHYNHLDYALKTKLTTMIKDFYFKNKAFTNIYDDQYKFINMLTDGWFLSGMDEFLYNRFHNTKNFGNTFVYLFNYRGEGSFTDQILHNVYKNGYFMNDYNYDYFTGRDVSVTDKLYGDKYNFGVCQNDDLLYLFPIVKDRMSHRVMNINDQFMQKFMTNMWIDFVTHGHPTTSNQQYKWNVATKYPIDYFRIGNYNKDTWYNNKSIYNTNTVNDLLTSGMQSGFYDDRVKFWRKFNAIRHQGNNFNTFMKVEL